MLSFSLDICLENSRWDLIETSSWRLNQPAALEGVLGDDCWFYGVRSSASHPTPNMEDQELEVSFSLDGPVRESQSPSPVAHTQLVQNRLNSFLSHTHFLRHNQSLRYHSIMHTHSDACRVLIALTLNQPHSSYWQVNWRFLIKDLKESLKKMEKTSRHIVSTLFRLTTPKWILEEKKSSLGRFNGTLLVDNVPNSEEINFRDSTVK